MSGKGWAIRRGSDPAKYAAGLKRIYGKKRREVDRMGKCKGKGGGKKK